MFGFKGPGCNQDSPSHPPLQCPVGTFTLICFPVFLLQIRFTAGFDPHVSHSGVSRSLDSTQSNSLGKIFPEPQPHGFCVCTTQNVTKAVS